MVIYPAIDLYDGKAVRLYKGDYAQMTVYSQDPAAVARDFRACGADHIHLVDLAGAKSGKPENLSAISAIIAAFGGFVEVGGGIRDLDTVAQYISLGVNRVILGTAAVKDPEFLAQALEKYGDRIAVGVDIKDGCVAIKGWTETSELTADAFLARMTELGVSTVICTDISRDGAMQGTNRALYKALSEKYPIALIASGGVSDLEDIRALKALGIHGAIVGKAYYIGAIDLKQAVEACR
jgi:phosphoribosylformimino-5-aminoimidazole carboxamide ribotide isomerase